MTGRPGPVDGGTDPSLHVYEAHASEWYESRRRGVSTDEARAFATDAGGPGGAGGPLVDLGSGPGWHTAVLGPDAIALDGARAMLDLVGATAPGASRVCADLRALPFRAGGIGGAFASRSYVHLHRSEVPAALADLHHSTRVGGLVEIVLFGGDDDHVEPTRDDFPGRRFSRWPDRLATDVLVGAGFSVESVAGTTSGDGLGQLRIRARRRRSIADTVGAGMVLLVCGLNPSLYAADRGVGYARPGNRFWPAALAAGLVTRDRDPAHALAAHGVGMTDLVKRATRRAAELSPTEYEAGLGRVGRLVEWLRPGALCVVGLAGWRAAVDPSAAAGVQPDTLGGRPVYLMPSTSGLNAHSGLEDLTDHLRAARAAASR